MNRIVIMNRHGGCCPGASFPSALAEVCFSLKSEAASPHLNLNLPDDHELNSILFPSPTFKHHTATRPVATRITCLQNTKGKVSHLDFYESKTHQAAPGRMTRWFLDLILAGGMFP
jgi:hypothetical protein